MEQKAPVAFVFHEDCLEHDNGPGHPERPERIQAIRDHLARRGLLDRLLVLRPDPAPIDRIARVHEPAYIEAIRRACERAPVQLDPDTAVSSGSWRAALLSAGGALAACDAVATGRARSAFVCTRPPGHHAEAGRAMGFCLFNNIALAARHLQDTHGLGRVLIVDWDVHHGNGTQHLFESDPTVFYFSTHQFPFYPGTGSARESGSGRGAGFTLNYPLPAGSGDAEYIEVFQTVLRPEIDRVQPEAILISAGFDGHRDDPLAGMDLTEKGYAAMTSILREAAERHCGGRIVSLLEGGYDLKALQASVEAHLQALGA
ncbi:MAG TPA: histone deacetylase [Candidatus Polarisedimenticolia bacterium]|jgi:acetoin utilization deacetylase AcuC-like enzyme|nr:histone deacetylase [Candidatus Polarisedimenticolia bacterium]